jgi:hypothetical protein
MKVKVALVHDWLTGMRGGERCLEVFCELFPEADLYTLIYQHGAVSPTIERMAIHPSLLQHIPHVSRIYRHLLPCLPLAIRWFRLTRYDLMIIGNSEVLCFSLFVSETHQLCRSETLIHETTF